MEATGLLKSSSDSEQKELLEFEQVKLLYAALPTTLSASLVIAVVLVVLEWDVTEHMPLIVWLASMSVVILLRLGLAFYYRHIQPEYEQTARWKAYFIIGSVAAGILWGSSSMFLFLENSIPHQAFLAFIIGGVCAGATTSLSVLLFPIFSFLFLALSPLIARFFMLGSDIGTTMGLMGTLFFIMISVTALKTHQNTKQNIELRMRSERQERIILESKLEQQAILDNAPVGIWLVGADGRYRFMNRTFCDAVGIPESEFLATTNLSDLLGEETAAGCLKSDRKCLEKNEPHLSHETITFADGKQHLMEITKAKVRDENDSVIGVVGIAVDITARQLAEERLRKLSRAVEQAGESVMVTDTQGIIEYVNPAFTKITGYSAKEVLGKNPRILKSGNQPVEYYKRLWRTISSGNIWKSAVVDRRKDGTQYPALLTISPILNDDGEITHYVGVQQDMTDHNILEEQFHQSQKMEAIGTLVGGIAHDFNNILTGITGNIDLALYQTKQFPEVTRQLKIAEDLSFKAADMIKQLMVFSRKSVVTMRPFGLISFMENISGLIKTSIPENINFHCDFCHEELVVKGDSNQIEQVLLNMLNNARDAVADIPEPMISLSIEEFEGDDTFLNQHPDIYCRLFAHIVIGDNGSGISDADRQHIFEPFFTTKEVGHGTGLGLSMAYGVVQSHHGILEVDSTLGKGTSFHVYLPLLEERKIDVISDQKMETVPGNGELILIVDDNADIRMTMKNILGSINYKVLEAVDGLEAVDVFAANQGDIALIIMDVVMPRLGGVKAVERIKQLQPSIKVIFATGYDRDETLKSEMPSDEYAVLPKPFNISQLSQLMKKQLDS
jgi:PAS domain S-box-containing protein